MHFIVFFQNIIFQDLFSYILNFRNNSIYGYQDTFSIMLELLAKTDFNLKYPLIHNSKFNHVMFKSRNIELSITNFL